MFPLNRLSLGVGKKLPVMLQTEATECGLACIAMISGYHGHHIDLPSMRSQFSVSLKGVGLNRLMEIAHAMNLATRALKLDLAHLHQLRLPCIIHWDFNHFVVLKEVAGGKVVIHDPAHGIRKLSFDEITNSFTGVALELWPASAFTANPATSPIKLRALIGNITGLSSALCQILLLSFALELFTLVQPFFLQWVIDEVIVSSDHDLLTVLAFGFGLLMLMTQVVNAFRAWIIMYVGVTLNVQWRANVFTHLLSLPVRYFEQRHLGDVVSRFGSVDTIQQTLTASFLSAIIDGLMTIITLTMMFIYSWVLGCIAVSAMIIYAVLRWFWYRPMLSATEQHIVYSAKQQSHFLETVRGIKTIKLFNRQAERRATWISLLIDQINAGLHTQKLQLLYQQMNGLLFGIQGILVVWLGATMVINDVFTVGALIAFIAYKSQFDNRVGNLIDKYYEIKMLQLQGERLADIIFAEPEAGDGLRQVPGEMEALEWGIEFKDVSFRYAAGEPSVLNKVSFAIEPGESVAVVGPSGCGKTTLINILLGVLAPTTGEVRFGGVEATQLGINRTRSLIGTVLQDDVLFAGSIADNICIFDSTVDYDWLIQCAMLAAVHQDIVGMPMGYNTLVGDMGTVLSGGQKQRVLLARALYKRPKILVLDEATSHLDLIRERQVNDAIGRLAITRIIVAHRPETIASAARVIELNGGRITNIT